MANITQVTLTNGLGTGGSGTISTLDNLIGTAGTGSPQVLTVQGSATGTPQPVTLASTTVTGTVAANATQTGTWTVQPGNTANTTAWKVDGSAVTQPISGSVSLTGATNNINNISGTVTLPTLASTSTKQSDGSQKTQVVDGGGNVIGATANALDVNIKSGASSGAVAQASTTAGQTGSLIQGATTTSAPTYTTATTNPLSLDTAGNLRVNVVTGGTSGTVAQGSTTSGQQGSLIQGAVTTAAPSYTTAQTSPLSLDTAGNLRVNVVAGGAGGGVVTQATGTNLHTVVDSGSITAVQGTGTNLHTVVDSGAIAATLAAETTKVIGVTRTSDGAGNLLTSTGNALDINIKTTALDKGSGTGGTGTQRVIVDSSQLSALGQTTMSASTPIVIASDQTYGNSTGAAVPAKAMYQGTNAITALPTAATAGNLVGQSSDKFGRMVSIPVTIRDLVGTQTTTISASTSETTIVTAAASTFNDLVMLIISNTSTATNTRIDFRDTTAGTVLFSIQSNGGQPPVGFALSVPIPQTTVNTNWTAQCATSTTDVRIYAVFAKNK